MRLGWIAFDPEGQGPGEPVPSSAAHYALIAGRPVRDLMRVYQR
jgi:hypothetical protein